MKTIYLLAVILLMTVTGLAEKIATLPELGKPKSLEFAGDELIIADGPEIFVYSAKEIKLKHRFGKPGVGPQELNVMGYRLYVYTQPTYFAISSKM
ncbi:MAG: hypothetical protein GY757_11090, partial [bacterium]|nr:hypothetical protein [bacterium]